MATKIVWLPLQREYDVYEMIHRAVSIQGRSVDYDVMAILRNNPEAAAKRIFVVLRVRQLTEK